MSGLKRITDQIKADNKARAKVCGLRIIYSTNYCVLPKGHKDQQGQPTQCQATPLEEPQPNPVGRPIERPGAHKGGYKLDKEDHDKLKRLAKAQGTSAHALATTIIEEYVRAQKEPQDPSQLLIKLLYPSPPPLILTSPKIMS